MSIELFVGAFVAGTSLAAMAGNLVEGRAKLRARLDRPFVDADHIGMSLLRVLFAGPYLLIGEASAARDEERCGVSTFLLAVGFATLWCLASGILCLEMLWLITQNFLPT